MATATGVRTKKEKGTTMISAGELVDTDTILHEMLENARQAATKKGHTMGPWRFEDAPAREFLVVARCTACNAELRVKVPVSEALDLFPLPMIDEYSAAFRYSCINPK